MARWLKVTVLLVQVGLQISVGVLLHELLPSVRSSQLIEALRKIRFLADSVYNKDKSIIQANNDGNDAALELDPAEQDAFLFEGDIILTAVQASDILQSTLSSWRMRSRRCLEKNPEKRWKNGVITYRFHDSMSQSEQTLIRQVLNFWQENTCLNFVFDDTATSEDHLLFFRGGGCYSMVGRYGGLQVVSIGNGCDQFGVIAHEIGHAIGLWHEQSRPDADDYIRVLPENVVRGQLYNFLKRSVNQSETFGIPYDYGSVMHYGPTAFTIDYTLNTIKTLKKGYQRTIGQREAPTFLDVALVNAAYCAGKCPSELLCQNGGYTHPRYCYRCLCPAGLGGTYCEISQPSEGARCGGATQAAKFPDWTTISSPNYPNEYEGDQTCSWLIMGEEGSRLLLKFFDAFDMPCIETCRSYVEVKNSSDFRLTGMRFCCASEVPEEVIWSESNRLLVIFKSDKDDRRKGFTARIQQYDYGGMGRSKVVTAHRRRHTTPTTVTAVTPAYRYQWSSWSSWSPCSRPCGACGLISRYRRCSGPTRKCHGHSYEHRRCNEQPCEGRTRCNYLLYVDQPCRRDGRRVCSSVDSRDQTCTLKACCYPYKPVGNRCYIRQGFQDVLTTAAEENDDDSPREI